MTRILKEFRYLQTCVVGDIIEDKLLLSEKHAACVTCTEPLTVPYNLSS